MTRRLLSILFLTLAAITANAQGFDPTPPGEPNALYKVSVTISSNDAGTVSGGGSFSTGRQVTVRRNDKSVSATSTVFYKFKCWMLNGVEYEPAGKSSSFTYTVGTEDAKFEAVYEEDDPDNVTSKLFLVAEPSDACTFNQSSGQRYFEDNYAYVYYNITSSAFTFVGWYEGDKLVSTSRYYNHPVGRDDATLTARFTYEPVIPGDPSGDQENVANGIRGDVNADGKVTISDAIDAMNFYLNMQDESTFDKRYDINGDGKITISDAIEVLNIYLTAQ